MSRDLADGGHARWWKRGMPALEQPRGDGSHDARDARLSGVLAALQVVRGVGAGWRGGWPFVAAAVTSPRFRMEKRVNGKQLTVNGEHEVNEDHGGRLGGRPRSRRAG